MPTAIYYRFACQNQSQSGADIEINYKDAGSPIKSGMTEKEKYKREWQCIPPPPNPLPRWGEGLVGYI